jgi:hypothetical protein
MLSQHAPTSATLVTVCLFAHRIGPERCLTVRWPVSRKDAGEVLTEDGPEVLQACLDAAEHVPIRGLFHFDAFRKEVGRPPCQCLCWRKNIRAAEGLR